MVSHFLTGRRLFARGAGAAVAAALVLVVLPGVAAAAPPALNNKQTGMLLTGQVLINRMTPTNDSGVAARAIGIVGAPPEKVWPVVRDCEHFKEFMPRTKESRVISKDGNIAICHLEISMPFPFSNLWSEVRSEWKALEGDGFERRWSLIKGSYKRNNGSWQVWPFMAGTQSLLVYEIDVDPDVSIPDAIIRKAQTGSLPDVFKAIRKRAAVK